MNNYISGEEIKRLRESKRLTQLELANLLSVSDKTISKWETGRGLPDISIIGDLAKVLNVSIIELFSGKQIINKNVCGNIINSKIYVCPICGNVIYSMGECITSCCGINLPYQEAEICNDNHNIIAEKEENELYIHMNHAMTKSHYISFIVYASADKFEIKKLYPEQNAEARFMYKGKGIIYAYCNKDGLFKMKI